LQEAILARYAWQMLTNMACMIAGWWSISQACVLEQVAAVLQSPKPAFKSEVALICSSILPDMILAHVTVCQALQLLPSRLRPWPAVFQHMARHHLCACPHGIAKQCV